MRSARISTPLAARPEPRHPQAPHPVLKRDRSPSRAVDQVADEVVRLVAVDVEHARPDAGIGGPQERDGRDGEPAPAVRA